MSKSKCSCTMAISMLGDGCEHCQPENTIMYLRERIEELELHNAMMLERLSALVDCINSTRGKDASDALFHAKEILEDQLVEQSAEWLESKHIEWMSKLPVGAYVKFWARQRMSGCEIDFEEGMEVCRKDEIGDDGCPATPLYSLPSKRTETNKK